MTANSLNSIKSVLAALKAGNISPAQAKQQILAIQQTQGTRSEQPAPQHSQVQNRVQNRVQNKDHQGELSQSIQAPASAHAAPMAESGAKPKAGASAESNVSSKTALRSLYQLDKVAIIGQSGRYPGAENLSEYWQNLKQGVDSVTEIPAQRWNVAEYYDPQPNKPGKVYCKWLGAINEPEFFDPLFFNIAPAEAEAMDPQFRLFLQESYHAFEDAGYSPEALNAVKCGVYLGIINGEYNNFLVQQTGTQSSTGASNAIGASRIAYYLNLKGPAIAMDTACSSSLIAMHIGCQNLLSGDIDMALAGGVSLYLTPTVFMSMCAAGMLSHSGRCKTFDNSADGFVPGEGVGTVIMKRLSDAERDNDHIYGVIIGSGSNQDGKTNGITAPSKVSQTQLIREVYERCGIDAASVSYVDTHGTGTKLGDPIELDALAAAFSSHTARRTATQTPQFCALGSVKSNIGHASAAAGVASVHKVLLQMQARELVPSLHFTNPNEHFDFKNSPFYVSTRNVPWHVRTNDRNAKRRAAVSSFGYSGTNVHVVLEEYTHAPPCDVAYKQPELIVLSARSVEQLQQQQQALLKHLTSVPIAPNLASVAHTLRVGRAQFAHRWACVVETISQLVEQLQLAFSQHNISHHNNSCHNMCQHNNSGQEVQCVWQSDAKPKMHSVDALDDNPQLRGVIQQWIESVQFDKVADIWARGVSIPWLQLWPVNTTLKVSLPGYPFAREAYWPQGLDTQNPATTPALNFGKSGSNIITKAAENLEAAANKRLSHPLLPTAQQMTNALSFPLRFTGDEFFFTDHKVQNQAILPAVAYLDLACAAMFAQLDATTQNSAQSPQNLVIKNSTWLAPFSPSAGQSGLNLQLAATNKASAYQFIANAVSGSSETNTCSQSVITAVAAEAPPMLDIAALRQRCSHQHTTANELYAVFTSMGLQYGPAHQGVQDIQVGATEVFAQVCLPANLPQQHGFVLHPAVLDAVLQTSLMLPSDNSNTSGARMPFALAELRLYRRLPNQVFAWIRAAKDSSQRLQKLDVDICDSNGQVCVQLRGFSSRVIDSGVKADAASITAKSPTAKPAVEAPSTTGLLQQEVDKQSAEKLHKLIPSWQSITPPLLDELDDLANTVLLCDDQQKPLSDALPNLQICRIASDSSIDSIQSQLQALGNIERLIWVVPTSQAQTGSDDLLVAEQHSGVRFALRLVKALLALNYGVRALQLVVVTQQAQAIHRQETIQPSHASIHGFIGSLCKEYHNWLVRIVDVGTFSASSNDCALTTDIPWKEVLRLTPHPFGDAYAYRDGEWFQRMLVPLVDEQASNSELAPYRQNGVYLVVGGAGGIGSVWSEWVSQRYNAQVIWIGRRAQDAYITENIQRIAEHGPAPWYVQADASDFDAFNNAVADIRQRLGERDINGVIHSAIVLADKSVAKMGEETFARSLDVKVAVSVNIAKVFSHAALDWLCFFSSLQSFTKEPGQCNYAAGCTFKDALAQRLNSECRFPVKTVNWGFWGSVGVVSQDDYRERMAQNGIGSIEPEEAMFALQDLLAGRLSQWGLLKTLRDEVLFNLCPPSRMCVYPELTRTFQLKLPQDIASFEHLVSAIHHQLPNNAQVLSNIEDTQALPEHTLASADLVSAHLSGACSSLRERIRALKLLLKTNGLLALAVDSSELDAAALRQLLASEGYTNIQVISSGTPMVVAASDGCVFVTRKQIEQVQQAAVRQPANNRSAVTVQSSSPSRQIHSSANIRELTIDYLLNAVSKVLKIAVDKLDVETPLEVYGLDSILSVQLTGLISLDITEISSTLFFEFPTLNEVAEQLIQAHMLDLQKLFLGGTHEGESLEGDNLGGDNLEGESHEVDSVENSREPIPSSAANTLINNTLTNTTLTNNTDMPAQQAVKPKKASSTDIAVIGMACKMPNAENTEQLWQNLLDGKDAVTEVPASRWDHSLYFDADKSQLGKTACKWGSFVDGIDQFDPLFFNISPNDAEFIDPQVRLMLHTSWALMEASGYTRDKFRECCDSNVGVYIGAHNQQYQLLETDYVISAAMSASAIASIPNRISSFLDLCGPSFAMDTFCSSSMIAIHTACNDLRHGETDMAIAGGVNHIIHPKRYLALGMAMLLGSDHQQSRSFGCGDGFIPSEGVGAVMLKRLDDAERDNDNILAVVKSTLQYHGGAGTGYGTTNQQAYSQLVRKNFAKANIDPSTISFMESAANGNALSDAVAISAMKSFFNQNGMPNAACGLGSIKSNFGHLEAASGVMQFIKVLLQIQHKQLPPTIYAEPMNPNIQLENSPFVVHRKAIDWQVPSTPNNPDGLRRAVVNTFGGGGSLAQVILEEYPEQSAVVSHIAMQSAQLVLLSARSLTSLQQRVQQLQAFINEQPNTDIQHLAHTLIYGREAMEYRCAFVVSDIHELNEQLDEWQTALQLQREANTLKRDSENQALFGSVFTHSYGKIEVTLSTQTEQQIQQLQDIAQRWQQGESFNWQGIFPAFAYRTMSLPTYPFDSRRCWAEPAQKLGYQDSKLLNVTTSFEEANQINTENLGSYIHSTIAAFLGLTTQELSVHEPLSRYQLLAAFLPRLMFHLRERLDISIDSEAVMACRTTLEIIELLSDGNSDRQVPFKQKTAKKPVRQKRAAGKKRASKRVGSG